MSPVAWREGGHFRRPMSQAEAEALVAGHKSLERKIFRKRSIDLLGELFHRLCMHLEVVTLVECGAREASASARFVGAGLKRRAVAFEANPYTYAEFTEKVSGPRLITVAEGLGEDVGVLDLAIPKRGQGLPTAGCASFRPSGSSEDFTTVSVPVTTLDRAVNRFAITAPVALWIDVEGTAREVLRGGEMLLQESAEMVLIELETEQFWKGAALAPELAEMLHAHNFVPVARDFQAEHQFNVLYLKASRVDASQPLVERYMFAMLRPVSAAERLRFSSGRSFRRLGRAVARKSHLLISAGVSAFKAIISGFRVRVR